MIERHVRDEQTAKHIDIGLACAGRAHGRGGLYARGEGEILRHCHMIGEPLRDPTQRPAWIDP